MEFISFDSNNKRLSLKKASVPKPGDGEVLVKVAYSGICGTDLHIIEGSFPCKQTDSLTLGHEFSGTIIAIGPNAKKYKVGQKVTVDPNSGCNLCNDCHKGCYHLCTDGGINNTIGIFRDGGWSTHVVAPEEQIFLLPDDLEMPQAALTEPLSCISHGWDIVNPVHVGERVLIIGAGIIGLLWACILHLHGLRRTVTISEPQEKRREMVKNLGLGFEARSPNELEGREFDFVVDCSGFGPAIEAAIKLLARGGRFCFFGVANPKTQVSIEPYQMYKKELSFYGVIVNPFSFPKAISLVQAMSDTYLNFEMLGIKVYKLSEYNEALEALKKGTISKAVFKL